MFYDVLFKKNQHRSKVGVNQLYITFHINDVLLTFLLFKDSSKIK